MPIVLRVGGRTGDRGEDLREDPVHRHELHRAVATMRAEQCLRVYGAPRRMLTNDPTQDAPEPPTWIVAPSTATME